ncbi:MAG: hypothetical protein AB7L09_03445 [Nitrospira sp.]
MSSVLRTYLVIAPLPVVVEENDIDTSYQPGAVFVARDTNPSVVRLLETEQIIETFGPSSTGTTVTRGQTGPTGPVGPTGPPAPPYDWAAVLLVGNTTGGTDAQITDGDAIVGQSDGGWDIGTPDGGSTLRRPATVLVQTSVIVGGSLTLGSGAITESGPLAVSVNGALSATAPVSTGTGADWTWNVQAGRNGTAGPLPTIALGGGSWLVIGGAGGAGQGSNTGGDLGADAGTGGLVRLVGGPGGAGQAGTVATAQPAIGGDLELFGGPGGAGAGTSNNANGGTVRIRGGILGVGGSGAAAVNGDVIIGDASTENLYLGGATSVALYTGGTNKWSVPAAGHLLAASDDTFDVGASGANRPRTAYIATSVVVGSGVTVDGNDITLAGVVKGPSDGSGVIVGQASAGASTGSTFQAVAMTTTERDDLVAANGMLLFNSTTGTIEGYNGTWRDMLVDPADANRILATQVFS